MKRPPDQSSENLENIDLALRPDRWQDYIGQEKIKENLKLIIEAARGRQEPCDHLLFYGQAGLGKTTLAYLIAKEIGSPIKNTSGPALERAGDIAAILTNVEPNEILFIDEVHRMNKAIEEILYPALENRKLNLIVGKGPSARTLSLDLPPFTLIAATTKVNMLSNPLRSRFGATFRLDYYRIEDIKQILRRSSELLKTGITEAAIDQLAHASRFTPRVANRLLKRARDFKEVKGHSAITEEVVEKILAMLEIDELGLEQTDRELLKIIIEKFNGGPVGVKALGAALNEEIATIEDIYEPFLMGLGLLERTPVGRVATPAAYCHLKIKDRNGLL